MTGTRVYFRIRFPKNAGGLGEWHTSNNGTSRWESVARIKAILTRGIQRGYKGRIITPFADYEVVQFTEIVETKQEVVSL